MLIGVRAWLTVDVGGPARLARPGFCAEIRRRVRDLADGRRPRSGTRQEQHQSKENDRFGGR